MTDDQGTSVAVRLLAVVDDNEPIDLARIELNVAPHSMADWLVERLRDVADGYEQMYALPPGLT